MVTLGLVSLVFAAFMLYRRRDIKRMFAYSSIEHMGIIIFAFGMGGPLANFAGLLHMTMHSLTKSAIFFAVGHIAQVKGTQRIADMGGLTETHPVLGWGLVLGVVAIAGLPPFGIFMSEFLVVSSTFARAPVLALILVFGLLVGFRRLVPAAQQHRVRRAARTRRRVQGLLRADVRASRSGAHGRHLSAAGAGRLVPERRQAARIDAHAVLADIIAQGRRVDGHRPWPRAVVTPEAWRAVAVELAAGACHAARPVGRHRRRAHGADRTRLGATSPSSASNARTEHFPSVGALHPPAIRLERAIQASMASNRSARPIRGPGSITASGTCNIRSARSPNRRATQPAYAFLPAEGESLHQIPVGPVHAGIIEPGHFRFTANGETVVRLEQRLGYVHKGIESLMAGATIETGGATRRPHLGRQHRRLRARLRPRRRGGAGHRRSAARALSARADGRARTARQSLRRHRRDLQRRLVRAHACALRHPARTHAARGRRLLRPSADDGPHRPRRRRRRPRCRWRRSA